MLTGDGLLPRCSPTQRGLIKAHFIKKEKQPEIQVDMNSWTRVMAHLLGQAPEGTKVEGVGLLQHSESLEELTGTQSAW